MKHTRTFVVFLAGLAVGAALLFSLGGAHFEWKTSHGKASFNFSLGDDAGGGLYGTVAVLAVVLGVSAVAARRSGSTSAAPTGAGPATFPEFLRQLTTSQNDCWIGGVCGGLGQHSPIPAWVWRLFFCCLILFYGTGVCAYILLWILIPAQSVYTADAPVSSQSSPPVFR